MIILNRNKYTNINKTTFTGSLLQKKCGSFLEKEISPYALGVVNYGSKVLISPLMMLLIAPFTKDWKKDKETIKCSAIIQPVMASLTLLFSAVTSFIANKIIDHYAAKGILGNFIDPELGKFFDPAKNPKNLSKLKNINTVVLTLAMIPVTCMTLNWVLPKILEKCNKGSRSHDKNADSVYVARFFPEFGKKDKLKEGKLYV
jgi:hypothetical protein